MSLTRVIFSTIVFVVSASAVCAEDAPAKKPQPVDFAREIAPIFVEHCVACHGQKVQEAEFRLDQKADFFRGGYSGKLLEPHQSAKSLLVARISGDEEGDRMPVDADPLSQKQISLIRRWIDEGAKWPDELGRLTTTHWSYVKPQRPAVPGDENDNWSQNPIDQFVRAKLIELGKSPSDRAAKTQLLRRVSLDLIGLPPTLEEIDAFLGDDSADAYEKVVDRLLASPHYGERWALPWLDAARFADSNGYQRDGRREAWAYRDWVIRALNGNMPFDQFTIEQIAGDLTPEPTLDQMVATGFHRNTMANVEAGTDAEEQRVLAIFDRVNTTGTVWLGTTMQCAQCHEHKYDPFTQEDYYGLFAFFNNTDVEIETRERERDFIGPKIELPEAKKKTARRGAVTAELDATKASLKTLKEELLNHRLEWEQNWSLLKTVDEKVPQNIQDILAKSEDERDDKQKQTLNQYYLKRFPAYETLSKRQEELEKRAEELAPDTTLVMAELPEPRMTRLFERGEFLNPGEEIAPATPSLLHTLKSSEAPTRMDLARWLVDEENPLVARVTINRYWAEFFGRGIVETLEDFGTQGSRPTHPELLDWLAIEFMESGWNVKEMHRLMVTSATYQQSSKITPEALRDDPYNQWYARGPRFRLRAELIRDTALSVAGLLSDKMHGPPVFPKQPDGIWNHIGRTSNLWKTSQGEDLYRRGVYVYWRRTVPYPSFVNFDAPSREACVVKRSRSNTPLQALTLLNDPVFFEAAGGLAQRTLLEQPEASETERLVYAFRLATGREPREAEMAILRERLDQERISYEKRRAAAEKMTKKWGGTAMENPVEFAAWVHVANIILNLDEVITKG